MIRLLLKIHCSYCPLQLTDETFFRDKSAMIFVFNIVSRPFVNKRRTIRIQLAQGAQRSLIKQTIDFYCKTHITNIFNFF